LKKCVVYEQKFRTQIFVSFYVCTLIFYFLFGAPLIENLF
jgi:hypothetical protein